MLLILCWIQDIHTSNKAKVILDSTNYATKRLEHDAGVNTSNSTAKRDFIALKPEVDKLNIDKSFNAPSGLSNFKKK